MVSASGMTGTDVWMVAGPRPDRGKPDRRTAVSLIEVMLAILILAMAVVPIITQFTSVHRMSVSARRLFEVSSNAQMILESLSQLEPEELPSIAAAPVRILSDSAPPASGARRWGEITAFFANSEMRDVQRDVTATRVGAGLLITVDLHWISLIHDLRTERTTQLSSYIPDRVY